MPTRSVVYGLILILAGVAAYFGTGAQSLTALIPAGFGAVLLLCGVIANAAPAARMHVMHVAALAGLIGALGGLGMSARKLPALFSGGDVERPLAVWMQFGMGVVLLIFLVTCIKSFADARRARSGQPS
jgi:hypothetical protein